MSSIFEIISKPLKLNPGVTTTPSPIPAPQPSLLKQFERPAVSTKLPEPKYKVRKQTFEDVKALKNVVTPDYGFPEETYRVMPKFNEDGTIIPTVKSTTKERLLGTPKGIAGITNAVGSLFGGASIFQKIAETKVGSKLADLGAKQEQFSIPKTPGEARAQRIFDIGTLFIGELKIGTGAASRIARSRNPVSIADDLVGEIKNLDRATADKIAPLLVDVDNAEDVQRTLNKIDFAKNKAKGPISATDGKGVANFEVTPERIAIASDFKKGIITEEVARKLMMAESAPKPTGKEVTLYHTTTPRAAKAISTEGFKKVKPEEQIGQAFGEGIYFSTTPEEAEAWKQFTNNNPNKGKVLQVRGGFNIYDPKVEDPAMYWHKLAQKAGIKTTPELGQEIADAYLMAGYERMGFYENIMPKDVYTEAMERSKKIIQALKEQGIDGAKFVEPIDPGEGIVNPQVVIFNTEKVNELLKKPKEALSVAGERGLRQDVGIPKEEARQIFREYFSPEETDFILTDKPIGKFGAEGVASSQLNPRSLQFEEFVKVVESNGKVPDRVLFHEIFEKAIQIGLDQKEVQAAMAKVISNPLSAVIRGRYNKGAYPTKEDRARELLADDFVEFLRDQRGYKGPNRSLWQKLVAKVREWVRKMTGAEKLYRDVVEKKRYGGNSSKMPTFSVSEKGGVPLEPKGPQKALPSLQPKQTPTSSPLRSGELSSYVKDTTILTNSKLNVDNLNISKKGKELIEKTVEEVKPAIEEAIGQVLSNSEAVAYAEKSSKILEKVITRESTLEWEASLLRARQKLSQMAENGVVDREFIDTLRAIKTQGTDIGRKLQSFSIGADPKEITSKQAIVEAVLKVTDNTDEILKAAEGVDFTNMKEATDFYRQFVKPNMGEWIDLIRYNSMLSSPKTHIVNIFSNFVNSSMVAPIEKALAGGLDFLRTKVTGNPRSYYAGEGGEYLKNYFANINDAAERFSGVMKGTRTITNLDTSMIPIAASGTKGRVVDTLSFPMRLLEGMDQFFTALGEGAEKAALNYRGGKGVPVGNVETRAQKDAQYRLFRQELFDKDQGPLLDAIDQFTQMIQVLRNNPNPIVSNIAKFTVPFIRTPMNIFKQGVEYSPMGFGTIPGAKNKTEQLSKAILGSAVFATAATLLSSNRLSWSEPANADQKAAFRASGKQAYSVKVGGTWYSYQKLPPAVAFPFAMVASIDDLIKNKKITDDAGDMLLSGIAKYGSFLADQSYAKSVGDFLEAAQGGEAAISRIISNYPQQLVPYRALGGWMARLFDPVQRKIDTQASFIDKQMQYMMMNIPGLSQGVPARVDAQGNEILQPNPKRNAVLPINTSTENPKAASDYEKLENLRRLVSEQNIESKELTAQAEKLDAELSQLPREEANKRAVEIKKTNPELFAKIKGVAEARKKNLSATEKQMMQLGVTNGNRAEYINEEILKLATPTERNEYLSQLRKKKIATDEVLKQLRALNKK